MKHLQYIHIAIIILACGCSDSTNPTNDAVSLRIDSVSYNFSSNGIKIKFQLNNFTKDTLYLQYSDKWPMIWVNYNVSGHEETRVLHYSDSLYVSYLLSGNSFEDTITVILEKGDYCLSGEGILSATRVEKRKYVSSSFTVK